MKNKHLQSLAAHLNLWIISLCVIIFIAVLGANYFLSRHLLEEYIERLANKTAQSTVQKVDTVLHSVASNADSLAAVVATPDITKKHIRQMTKAFVENNSEIFGMTVALEPDVLFKSSGDFAPYYFKKDGDIAYTDLANDSYDYKNWRWYSDTKKANTTIWSEPYVDEGGGNVHMVTYSTPVYLADGDKFAGVATADIKLSWLDDIIQNSKIGKSGFGFIVSKNDIIIAYPDKSLHMKPLSETNISTENWHKYLNSKTSFSAIHFSTPCNYRGGHCWVAIKTLKSSGWKIIIVLPEQELTADINALTLKISVIAIAGLIILFFVIVYITRTLTNPLGKLAVATRDIGAGNLDIELPETIRKDEIGALTDDFNSMRSSLKNYITEIQQTTARQQKLESEIQIAKDIQMSMIPGAGHVSIKQKSHQLFALLRPARSVGGDLYYFQQSDEMLHFIIGDVSDKGVPAALFMAKTVTLYTRALKDKLSPGETFTMMNDMLTQNNNACMFVTALCGSIDLSNGSIVMANAGHMNPIIKSTTETSEVNIDGAIALGLMEDVKYSDIRFQLDSNTSLIMYTDGISEAHDKEDRQYSDEKLIRLISGFDKINADDIGNSIINNVDDHAADTEQFDDITLLIIHLE
ncbi:MAG: SpoIIE family protein phosphatase [Gammaproteobacteria bacterium]